VNTFTSPLTFCRSFVATSPSVVSSSTGLGIASVHLTLQPQLEVVNNRITGVGARGYSVVVAASDVALTPTTASAVPPRPVSVMISWAASGDFVYTELVPIMSLSQLASSIIGLLGILGGFGVVFACVERACPKPEQNGTELEANSIALRRRSSRIPAPFITSFLQKPLSRGSRAFDGLIGAPVGEIQSPRLAAGFVGPGSYGSPPFGGQEMEQLSSRAGYGRAETSSYSASTNQTLSDTCRANPSINAGPRTQTQIVAAMPTFPSDEHWSDTDDEDNTGESSVVGTLSNLNAAQMRPNKPPRSPAAASGGVVGVGPSSVLAFRAGGTSFGDDRDDSQDRIMYPNPLMVRREIAVGGARLEAGHSPRRA
jgi:hypothetical protein